MNNICMVDSMVLAMVTVQAQNSLYVFAFQGASYQDQRPSPNPKRLTNPKDQNLTLRSLQLPDVECPEGELPEVELQSLAHLVKAGNSGKCPFFKIKEFKLRKCQKRKPVCTVCKWSFPDWSSLTEHWKKKHGGQDSYKCDQCDKVTHSLASHKKHILLHQEDKRKLKCFVCGHKFNFQSELDRHNAVHLDE